MAVTSIWRVKGILRRVVDYAKNPDKTANPEYEERPAAQEESATDGEQWLNDVINYATRPQATHGAVVHDEGAEILRRFVTGVNCIPETARDEMQAVKLKFGKTDGVIAYHGYQSFAPGEATPETAHEIGVKLAGKLWGERYQVVVATHLDKESHIHSHFVLNNVSMIDGKKYYRSERDYYNMQCESDALCREYGLSVIREPKRGKSKHYAEWNAERNGHSTWRGMVKSDVDAAIRQSMTERQFFGNLKRAGYGIKIGKDISVRPPGKERFVRLARNFGEDYAIEGIRRRILAQNRPERHVIQAEPPPKRVRVKGNLHRARKLTGLRALYFYYLYRMGVLPRKRAPNPKRVYFLFREDIRHMQSMAREIRLMAKHGIDTAERLTAYKDGANAAIKELSVTRKRLRNQTRSVKDETALAEVKSQISALTEQITELRREVRSCESIESRSLEMKDKLHRVRETELQEQEKSKTKELMRDEPFRHAAEQIVRMSLEGVEVAAKITGTTAKEIALLLMAALKNDSGGKLKTKGRARLESMLKSGKALEIFSVRERDLQTFVREVKRYGIVYCVLRNSKHAPDGLCDIMVKADDAPKINRLVERFKFAAVDKAKIESEIIRDM
ncbi:MAG: relaxase/mobilization nuclease domain-containing protein, partial [Treponema sp.]|nr:relaxase/mobilization nuclease domain-containing protein [Treponema sp.]